MIINHPVLGRINTEIMPTLQKLSFLLGMDDLFYIPEKMAAGTHVVYCDKLHILKEKMPNNFTITNDTSAMMDFENSHLYIYTTQCSYYREHGFKLIPLREFIDTYRSTL